MNKYTKLLFIGLASVVLNLIAFSAFAEIPVWEVIKGKSSYILFGSVHAFETPVPWLTKDLREKIVKSDTIFMEVRPEENKHRNIVPLLDKYAFLTDQQSITDFIRQETNRQLTDVAKRTNFPEKSLNHFRPWFAAIVFSQYLEEKAELRPEIGVEATMVGLARTHNIKVIGLETNEARFRLMAGLDNKAQDKLFYQSLIEAENYADEFNELVMAYLDGDTQKLDELIKRGMPDEVSIKEAFLYERNRRWAGKIDDYFSKGLNNAVVVVGIAHMVGKNSVIDLLQRKGFNVRRIQ